MTTEKDKIMIDRLRIRLQQLLTIFIIPFIILSYWNWFVSFFELIGLMISSILLEGLR